MQNTIESPFLRPTDSVLVPENLALLGGEPAVADVSPDLFTWPIVTQEDEAAVLDVLRKVKMSSWDVTQQFEAEFARWQGSKYALGFNNGTASLQAAMFGIGVGIGDEVICPSITYWASALPAFSLGATVIFADIHPQSLCIDPADIEHRITLKTKAIVVVHYVGHPCDMNAIMEIAKRHNLKVVEDVSHAQGGFYEGRKLGTIGDVAGMSLMTGKSFAIGEAGILTTDNREIYERALAWGHYERFVAENIETPELKPFVGMPLGGYKYRMHQVSSAMGRVQLRHYDERCAVIRKSMNYFWELLEDVPGLSPHRVDDSNGSNMAGWYHPVGHYHPEALGGLPVAHFATAVCAEGVYIHGGINRPLHRHAVFNDCDIYGHGKPTRIANSDSDVRLRQSDLPVTEGINNLTLTLPWFKHFDTEAIEAHALAFRKVALNHEAVALWAEQSGLMAESDGRIGLSAKK